MCKKPGENPSMRYTFVARNNFVVHCTVSFYISKNILFNQFFETTQKRKLLQYNPFYLSSFPFCFRIFNSFDECKKRREENPSMYMLYCH